MTDVDGSPLVYDRARPLQPARHRRLERPAARLRDRDAGADRRDVVAALARAQLPAIIMFATRNVGHCTDERVSRSSPTRVDPLPQLVEVRRHGDLGDRERALAASRSRSRPRPASSRRDRVEPEPHQIGDVEAAIDASPARRRACARRAGSGSRRRRAGRRRCRAPPSRSTGARACAPRRRRTGTCAAPLRTRARWCGWPAPRRRTAASPARAAAADRRRSRPAATRPPSPRARAR